MVMSEGTGGVNGVGLLVFLGCWTLGPYIDPDQQGDLVLFRNIPFLVKTGTPSSQKGQETDYKRQETN